MPSQSVVRNTLILFGMSILCTLAGCSGNPSGDSKAEGDSVVQVPPQIPLPPNPTSTAVEINKNGTKISVTATYKNTEQGAVLGFYRDYFQQNGWITGMSSESENEISFLYYTKGRTEIDVDMDEVSSEESPGELEVGVSFSEYPYTRDEFQKLCAESMTPEVSDIVAGVAKAYASLTTYRDTGTHELEHEGKQISRSRFETRYVAPDRLFFSYRDTLMGFFTVENVLAVANGTATKMASFDDDPHVEQDIDRAMAGLYGVTFTTSGTVPGYLLGREVHLFGLLDLSLLDEADAGDGTRCIRLRGAEFGGGTYTIWIGKGENLIRRVEFIDDEGNQSTVNYSPQHNAKVSDAELEFRRPMAEK